MTSQTVISAGDVLLNYHFRKDAEITLDEVLNSPTVQDGKQNLKPKQSGSNFADSVGDQLQTDGLFTTIPGKFEYNMNHAERGCFLIFNQEKFDHNIASREGTNTDAYNIFVAATAMGFEYIKTLNNLTKEEMLSWVKQVAMASHASYDCFGCAIMSHGDDDDTIFARDGPVKLSELTSPFSASNCPTLAGKPKLFFVQACRGKDFDKGMPVRLLAGPDVRAEQPQKIPNEADFLLAYSTVPGYVAWLNSANGSWFIQSLCICIHQYCDTMEFLQIMTRVNNMVAFCFESSGASYENDSFKQIPSVVTRLTADLYFGKRDLARLNGVSGTNGHKAKLDEGASEIDIDTRSHHVISEEPGTKSPEKKKKSSSLGKWFRRSVRRQKK